MVRFLASVRSYAARKAAARASSIHSQIRPKLAAGGWLLACSSDAGHFSADWPPLRWPHEEELVIVKTSRVTKRAVVLVGLLTVTLGVFACSDDSPVNPSPATQARFSGALSPAQETPPVTGPETSGSGTVNITFNLTRDASGNLTAATAVFDVSLSGFPANTPINLAHIHPGRAGVAGGVYVNTGLSPGEVVLANGSGNFTKTVDLTVDQASAIMADAAAYYFNVHSSLNPTGAARGQLTRLQ